MFTDEIPIYLNIEKLNEKWIVDYNLSGFEPDFIITTCGEKRELAGRAS